MHNRRRVISGPNIVLPSQIGSVAAWYRYGQGITQAGGFASAWADQSGNGRNLTQGTGAAQPAVNADGSLLFNGTSHFMQASFTLEQPTTVCMLARQISWIAGDVAYDGFTANTGQLQQITASPQVRLRGSTGLSSSNLWTLNTYAALVGVFINGLNASVLRINNGTEATAGNIGTATGMGGLTLGANGVPASYSNIEVKEVVVFPIFLSATQRQLMVKYLASVGNLVI